MALSEHVVVTGIGIVSPIGIGREPFWNSLREQRSGIDLLQCFDVRHLPVRIGGEVRDFDPKEWVKPRKSLKVMSRDIQLSYAAARLACDEAGLTPESNDPERLGVVFGADMIYCELPELQGVYKACMENDEYDDALWGARSMSELNPLWMLKYLPNMPACHIGIAQDARGPNNSITMGEISSLAALAEGIRVIERGAADVVIVGGGSSRLHPMPLVFRNQRIFSHRNEAPQAACRPFDADRDGMVYGEGAGAVILERQSHARRRGARPWCRITGYASRFGMGRARSDAIRDSLAATLRDADLDLNQLGFVSANGLSSPEHDPVEAQAIRDVVDGLPVTAPKSFFGNLGAASGAVELIAAILALRAGEIPVTLNYETPDPRCPVEVVHREPRPLVQRTAAIMSQTTTGQAMAVAISGEE